MIPLIPNWIELLLAALVGWVLGGAFPRQATASWTWLRDRLPF